jgi:hypothetical protein
MCEDKRILYNYVVRKLFVPNATEPSYVGDGQDQAHFLSRLLPDIMFLCTKMHMFLGNGGHMQIQERDCDEFESARCRQ